MQVTNENARLAVVDKLSWIKKQQKNFRNQPRQSAREYISGECHYVFGKRYRLELIERDGKPEVKLLKSGKSKLFVKAGASVALKEKAINAWYRQELQKHVPEVLSKWQRIVGKKALECRIKKMKTKWGSCNIGQRRIWLNLELAKKPPECLEYILVHELVHLHERNHKERFKVYMDKFMPNWRLRRELLNRSPLANEDWDY